MAKRATPPRPAPSDVAASPTPDAALVAPVDSTAASTAASIAVGSSGSPVPGGAPGPKGPHLVLSRKYRPGTFGELVGQEHVAQTLANAIASGRIGHAYLFIGPRGTGKTTTARIFAKALNCERGPTPEPCGVCGSCVGITKGNDLDVVEMDAASNNGVDDVRALRDSVGYRPSRSRFRIWIVDEVHMLSLPAFNAFLKTLEEPPPQAKFLFCTTEAHKLPETFLSRVQRLEFRRIDETLIVSRLESLAAKEGLALDAGVCVRIASGALGGLRDAESLLEQLLSCAQDGRVTLADLDAVSGRAAGRDVEALLAAVGSGDAGAALDAAAACLSSGAKPDVVLDQTVEAFRGLLSIAARRKPGAAAPQAGSDPATERAVAFGLPRIARSLDLLLEKRRHLKDGADGRLVVEVAAVELARLPSARDLDALVTALSRATVPVEPGAAGGGTGAGGGTAGGGGGGSPIAAGSSPRAPSGYGASNYGASSYGASGSGASGSGASGSGASGGGPGAPEVSTTGVDAASTGYGPPRPGSSPAPRGYAPPPSPSAPTPPSASAPRAAGPDAAAGPEAVRERPSTSVGPVALAAVVAGWAAVVAGVTGRSRRVGSALARTRVVGVGADVVTLAISAGDIVAKGALREREAAELVREVTRDVLGVTLRPAVEDEAPGVPPRAPIAATAAPAPGTPSPPAPSPGAPPPAGAALSPAVAAAPLPTATALSPNQGLDEVRAHPTVKAVLDAFGARVLAVQRVEPDAPPPVAPGLPSGGAT